MAVSSSYCQSNVAIPFTLLHKRCDNKGGEAALCACPVERCTCGGAVPAGVHPGRLPPSCFLGAGRRLVPPLVRGNLLVGLADLCTRHPNVLEPWTALLYCPLQDPDHG